MNDLFLPPVPQGMTGKFAFAASVNEPTAVTDALKLFADVQLAIVEVTWAALRGLWAGALSCPGRAGLT